VTGRATADRAEAAVEPEIPVPEAEAATPDALPALARSGSAGGPPQTAGDAAVRPLGALVESTKAAIKAAEQSGADGSAPGGNGTPPSEPNQSVAP
jgi:hypothetical protein